MIRPLLFVAMPFGKKLDPSARVELDFDDVYERAIRPAAENAELDVVRADEEVHGGLIHVGMYERLLLAEIVVADLTLSNPNVFYELGVRHAAKPRTTILVYAKGAGLPFDVAPIRAIPYTLEEGRLSHDEAARLRELLADRLAAAREESEQHDSPLFQLIREYPGINLPHEVTETFRDRVRLVNEIRDALDRLRGHEGVRDELMAIEKRLQPFANAPVELLVDLLLSYRSVEGWSDMVRLVDSFPTEVARAKPVREQLALALNRRNEESDRGRAISIVEKLIDEGGPSPETNGILGRIHKDVCEELEAAGRSVEARAALDAAIDAYSTGFDADPRDYYPGVNAITLLIRKGDPDSLRRARELEPVVAFAVGRRGGLSSSDYWDVATVLELSVIGEDWPTAERAAGRVTLVRSEPWMLETTARNLRLIAESVEQAGGDRSPIDGLIAIVAPS